MRFLSVLCLGYFLLVYLGDVAQLERRWRASQSESKAVERSGSWFGLFPKFLRGNNLVIYGIIRVT